MAGMDAGSAVFVARSGGVQSRHHPGENSMRHIHSGPAALLAAGLLFAGNAAAQYAPVGVQANVPAATVSGGGWSTCFSSTFAESGTPLATIQANCDKAQLMMACRPVGAPNFTLLAAAPRTDVFTDTGTGNTPHDANGVGWYYNDSYSWGFAPQGAVINRNSCDYDDGTQTQTNMRMCIHTSGSTTSGGYRCGANDLNGDSGWERVILESDGAAPGVHLGSGGASAPVLVAEELKIPPSRTIVNVGNRLDVIAPLGYAFSPGEVRYAAFTCPGIVFGPGTTVDYSGDASNTIGAINGIGTSVIFFSVTAGANPVTAGDTLAIGGNRVITSKASVDCHYGLYDLPSQAQAGGSGGRVAMADGGYLRFGPSYELSVDSEGKATADVESATTSYSAFTVTGPTFDSGVGQLGGFSYGTTGAVLGTNQPITLDGDAIALSDLMGAATALVFHGDFSAAGDVYLSIDSDCGSLDVSADAFDDASAVFTVGNGSALNRYLCFEAGGDPIPAGDYTVGLEPVSASASTYAVADLGPYALGEIAHNGTHLQAPLVQVGGAIVSRMVLTNTGGIARPYVVTILRETDNTGTPGPAASGVVPAHGTAVVDVASIVGSFDTGAPRATLDVTVAGPDRQIQGMYQIVDPANGTVANHVMVRPGTN